MWTAMAKDGFAATLGAEIPIQTGKKAGVTQRSER
jgi:hypothetical protein